ncbi:MAG: acyltransferase [Ignavibacteriales bacterium]|nr:acyltransferase [Ignavibacteriales bacterium]
MFGPEVMIRGGDHNFSYVGKPMRQVKEGGINLPSTIEDDVWIGTRAIILKGVTIREGSVIGAGSIVSKDILPYSVSAGIPCKPIRCRFTGSDLEKHLSMVNSKYSLEEIISLYSNQNLKDLIV